MLILTLLAATQARNPFPISLKKMDVNRLCCFHTGTLVISDSSVRLRGLYDRNTASCLLCLFSERFRADPPLFRARTDYCIGKARCSARILAFGIVLSCEN